MTSQKPSYVREYLTAISINVSALLLGALPAGISFITHTFRSSEGIEKRWDAFEQMIPMNSFGIAAGSIIAYIMNIVGRKKTVLIATITGTISWILMIVANAYIYFVSILFMEGVTIGIIYTVVPIYIGEIASDKIRGSLGCLLMLMYWIGCTSATVLGQLMSYNNLSYISLILPFLIGLNYIWIPETPTYYLMQHRDEEAKALLKFLRNNRIGTEFDLEFESLLTSVREDEKKSEMLPEVVRTVGNRKAILIMAMCAVSLAFCRMEFSFLISFISFSNYMDFFGFQIMLNVRLFYMLLSLVGAVLSLCTVDCIGRRKLLLVSAVCLVLSNLASAGFVFMKSHEIDVTYLYWIPALSTTIAIISNAIGFNTISFVLLGELFPNNIKDIAALLFVLFYAGLHALYFGSLLDALDVIYTFILNSIIMSIAFTVIFFFLPETKGKSLREIQFMLNNKS